MSTKPTYEELEARVAELEMSLAAIGDLACIELHDEVVGKVDAVVKQPQKYAKKLRDLFDARNEVVELRATLSHVYEANMRGIQLWQEANPGNDLTWPSQDQLVAWLIERSERMAKAGNAMKHQLLTNEADLVATHEKVAQWEKALT